MNTNLHSKKKPKVSIGMAVYNGQAYLREAVDSLLVQSFTDFELIISDNASTDLTEVICTEYIRKDSRIRYIRQTENMGPIKNFQFVLNEASADYFMWAAADDLIEPTFIDKLYNIMIEDPSYALTMSDIVNISEEGKVLYTTTIDNIRVEDVNGH